ncbi:hypothetical protein EDB84DRAFT_1525885 [Lactarius hengduanensis]|nr:hypothetical protein EDB84DRAFT_1525885 [Lactarius hengduanensis]
MAPRTTPPLLITVIGLAPSFGIGALYYRDPYSSRVASLAARLHEEETRYAAKLKARQGLIKKPGPIKEIESHGDFFILSFQCPHHVERVGVLCDGGKRVVTAGINGKSSFKAALLELCEYDFTVDSAVVTLMAPRIRPNYTFDALKKPNDRPASPIPSPCHTFIDMLKIDVEGAEFDTLTVFLETHKLLSLWDDYGKFDFFHDWWAALEAAGTRPFLTESNFVYVNYNRGKPRLAGYSFMNIRGNHSLVYEAADGADAY